MSRVAGKRLTESTNGSLAYRLTSPDGSPIYLRRRWLHRYGLEVYLPRKILPPVFVCGLRQRRWACAGCKLDLVRRHP